MRTIDEASDVVAVICFMWDTEGVWKCSIVIRMDEEGKVEEEEALGMATALARRMA